MQLTKPVGVLAEHHDTAPADDAITLVGGSPKHPSVLATPGALEGEARGFTIQQNAPDAKHGGSRR